MQLLSYSQYNAEYAVQFCYVMSCVIKHTATIFMTFCGLFHQAEVDFLGRLQHPNLVKLLGYCYEGTELLLVYEFMQKGSLENHLFGSKKTYKHKSSNIIIFLVYCRCNKWILDPKLDSCWVVSHLIDLIETNSSNKLYLCFLNERLNRNGNWKLIFFLCRRLNSSTTSVGSTAKDFDRSGSRVSIFAHFWETSYL